MLTRLQTVGLTQSGHLEGGYDSVEKGWVCAFVCVYYCVQYLLRLLAGVTIICLFGREDYVPHHGRHSGAAATLLRASWSRLRHAGQLSWPVKAGRVVG